MSAYTFMIDFLDAEADPDAAEGTGWYLATPDPARGREVLGQPVRVPAPAVLAFAEQAGNPALAAEVHTTTARAVASLRGLAERRAEAEALLRRVERAEADLGDLDLPDLVADEPVAPSKPAEPVAEAPVDAAVVVVAKPRLSSASNRGDASREFDGASWNDAFLAALEGSVLADGEPFGYAAAAAAVYGQTWREAALAHLRGNPSVTDLEVSSTGWYSLDAVDDADVLWAEADAAGWAAITEKFDEATAQQETSAPEAADIETPTEPPALVALLDAEPADGPDAEPKPAPAQPAPMAPVPARRNRRRR